MSATVTNSVFSFANLSTGCVSSPAILRGTLAGVGASQKPGVYQYYPSCVKLPDVTSENVTNNSAIQPLFATPTFTWSLSPLTFSGSDKTSQTKYTLTTQPGAILHEATLTGPTLQEQVPVRQNRLDLVLGGIKLDSTVADSLPPGTFTLSANMDILYAVNIDDPTQCTSSVWQYEPALLRNDGITYVVGPRGPQALFVPPPYVPIKFAGTVGADTPTGNIYLHIRFTQGTVSDEFIVPLNDTDKKFAWVLLPGTNVLALQILLGKQEFVSSSAFTAGTATATVTLLTSLYTVFGHGTLDQQTYALV